MLVLKELTIAAAVNVRNVAVEILAMNTTRHVRLAARPQLHLGTSQVGTPNSWLRQWQLDDAAA
ncbi:hypothetical protein GN244_ATG17525 [Phytophthora infestans]|uniref:Uncharacterized protein n=1 Tax=Phytophthora infestans TaxID=4787 RepID=A0A833W6H7_PHYIN|nr:hypothetical protein GN244_ATG17525 [Phytophthora infestans]